VALLQTQPQAQPNKSAEPMSGMNAASPEEQTMGMEDSGVDDLEDGLDDDEFSANIQKNLEEHLNSLPDEGKAFLAEYATIPEVAQVIGLINGREVYDYFSKYVDPNKRIQVLNITQGPAAQPMQGQPQPGAMQQPMQQSPTPSQPASQPQAGPQGVFKQ
jgi:hypothetical protein